MSIELLMPSNHLILCHPLLLLSSIFPSITVFSNEPVLHIRSGGQSIGVSALTSVLPMNPQDWSPLRWTGWISLQSKGLSRVFYNTTVQKHQFCTSTLLQGPTLTSIRDYWKNHKWMSESEVTQSCPTCCNRMDCSLPGSSVHGIFQAIVLEWIAISFSRGSSQPRDWTWVSQNCRQMLYHLSHQGSPIWY